MTNEIHTVDIKLASLLVAFDIPWRKNQPVTCNVETKGGKEQKQFTFWFSVNECADFAKSLVNAFFKYRESGVIPIEDEKVKNAFKVAYDSMATREGYIYWMNNFVTAGSIVKNGGITGWLATGSSPQTKEKFKRAMRSM